MFILISACYLEIFAFEGVIELLQFNHGPCISQDSFGIATLFPCFFDSQSLSKGRRRQGSREYGRRVFVHPQRALELISPCSGTGIQYHPIGWDGGIKVKLFWKGSKLFHKSLRTCLCFVRVKRGTANRSGHLVSGEGLYLHSPEPCFIPFLCSVPMSFSHENH